MAKKLCSVCVSFYTDTQLDCKFRVCLYCLKSWILQRIEDSVLSGEITVPCVDNNCSHPITRNQIISYFKPGKLKSEIDDALLNLYLTQTKDIRSCPSPTCSYSGYILESPCALNNVCEKCCYEWKDQT